MQRQERDLRDLVFGDSLSDTPEAELHAISSHPERREELNRLLRLRESMLSLSEEEPPRRIVLAMPPQPDRRRWWSFGFASPGWGFAGACALSAAIIFHAMWVPGAGPSAHLTATSTPVAQPAAAPPAEPDAANVQVLVDSRVAIAVAKLREDLDAAHRQETARMVHAAEHRLRTEHEEQLFQVREAMIYMNKQYGRQLVTNAALVTELQSRDLQ